MPQYIPDDIYLERLPHTLYNITRVTATSYSKVSRGLRFPLEISGLPTRRKCSEACSWGQWGARYALHARHQSNDKALRSQLLLSPILGTNHISVACKRFCLHPCIAARVGLYLHPSGVRRTVSEDSRYAGRTLVFIVAVKRAIFSKPSKVKCSRTFIISIIVANVSKSLCFFVCSGCC